jgi:hypothetical protein
MATENSTIRIKAERLGTVKEVRKLLKDFDKAYNSIYAFNFLVDSLVNDYERKRRLLDDKFHDLRKYWKEFYRQKDFPYDPFFFEIFWDKHLRSFDEPKVNLLELQAKIDFEKVLLPSDTLIINKVNIQSPGFWEFLGALNPLQQIREYLNDRHERNKDKKYRSRQEEELGDLSIMEKKNNIVSQRIEILKGLGYSETEIRQLVSSMIIEPLNKLGQHQDRGLIEGQDNTEQ